MQKVSKSEKALEILAKRTGMTEQGKAWLEVALDPFHDGKIDDLVGYPDGCLGNSIVQTVTQQLTVSKPAGLTAPNNWDCVVTLNPVLTATGTSSPVLNTSGFLSAGSGSVPILEGLSVNACNPGLDGNYVAPSVCVNVGELTLPPQYCHGSYRVISMGYEIYDTTADLYKQGTITTYEIPETMSETNINLSLGATGLAIGTANVRRLANRPLSVAQATLYPNSRTWDMKKGVYTVATMSQQENVPERNKENSSPILYAIDGDKYYPGSTALQCYANVLPISTVNAGCIYLCKHLPFNTKQSWLTGLNSQTTFTVVLKYVIERFPTPIESSDLTVLATATAEYDPVALEAYTACMRIMPSCVEVAENGLGDWFCSGVASIIDTVTGTKWATNLYNGGDKMYKSMSQPVGQIKAVQQNGDSQRQLEPRKRKVKVKKQPQVRTNKQNVMMIEYPSRKAKAKPKPRYTPVNEVD